MERYIYLDNAATTRTEKEVLEEMLPYFRDWYGNPSSVYELAVKSKKVINKARMSIAGLINGEAGNVFFTGGGSEADNWALKCTAEMMKSKGRHIITTKLEHHAILNTCEYLRKNGYDITYMESDENGIINPDDIRRAIRRDTILISVMFANNEIGTIQPIAEIGNIAGRHDILFHTDAVQALGHVKIDVKGMNIDMLSGSAHKLGGPKGIGILYMGSTLRLPSFIHGGGQEKGLRAGTENVPAIAGFGKAAELASEHMEEHAEYERHLLDYLISRVMREIPYTRLNGDRTRRLSGNANFSFQFIEGETLLIMLDMKGICCSTGSACNATSISPSHVLTAIGLPEDLVRGSIRITLNHETTRADIDDTVEALKETVAHLRGMNPVFHDFKNRQQI